MNLDKKWVLTRFLIFIVVIGSLGLVMYFGQSTGRPWQASERVQAQVQQACVDEMVTLTSRPQSFDSEVLQVTRASCSHKEHRITDVFFGGTYFMCRCNPDKIYGNNSFWVDPVYKEEKDIEVKKLSLKFLGEWLEHAPEHKHGEKDHVVPPTSNSVKKP